MGTGLVATSLGALTSVTGGCAPARPNTPAPTVLITPVSPSEPQLTSREPLPSPPLTTASRPTPILWESSVLAARELARRRDIPLLVYVRADWASSALSMERKTWSDPRVIAIARSVVALKVDVTSAEGSSEVYAQDLGITSVPEVLLFDPAGHRLASLPGEKSADEIVAALQHVAQ